jgi:hypothetical protein
MRHSYAAKLEEAKNKAGTNVALLLRPLMAEMPAPMHYYDDPFFPFSKAIITATSDIVCGYVFDFAAYMAHGAAGAVALERSMAYAGTDAVKILHGAFVGTGYIEMIYENAFGADAATITHSHELDLYTDQKHHGAYIVQWGDGEASNLPTYHVNKGSFVVGGVVQVRVAGESVLYAGYGDDHAEQCRAALAATR